jgi:hypothetical protein
MKQQYLMSIFQPGDGTPPSREVLEPIMRNIFAVTEEMKQAGAFVFTGGLHAPRTATVLRAQNNEVLITDGPYVEGKEHLGGVYIIEAEDLDAALHWGRKLAQASTLPIEIRPFQSRGG